MKLLAALLLTLGLIAACGSSDSDVPTVGGTSAPEEVIVAEEDEPMVVVEEEAPSDATAFSDVPDDWPADLPVPDGGILEAWTMPFDDDIRVSWRLDGTPVMDVGRAYDEALASIDFSSREYFGSENEAAGTYSSAERELTFTVTPASDGAVSIYVEHRFVE